MVGKTLKLKISQFFHEPMSSNESKHSTVWICMVLEFPRVIQELVKAPKHTLFWNFPLENFSKPTLWPHHFIAMALNIYLWIFLINTHWVKTIGTKRVLSWVNWRCLWEGFFSPLGSRKPWRLIENEALKDPQTCSSFTIVGQSFDLHCFQSYLTNGVNENMFLTCLAHMSTLTIARLHATGF